VILHVDESWILEVAERAGHRDPAAVIYLEASNIPVSTTREQLTALAHELNNPRCTAARIASFLRTWKP
jgi:hypothetical protein